jgi:glycosyltransferase involved in cell wall biosynthesis
LDQKRSRAVFLHSSDELYGADRMLLAMLQPAERLFDLEVWLPVDLEHPANPLCHELAARGIAVRHCDLPIMRRANRSPRGVQRLLADARALRRDLREAGPEVVYCTTSPAFIGAVVERLAGVPTVLGHCQEIWSSSDRVVLSGPALACQRILVISQATSDSMPRVLRRRTVLVPNGTPAPATRTPLSRHCGELRFLVASRWNGWKGHQTLLDAWEAAGAPGHLTIIGGPPLSGEKADVPSMVERLSRPDTVTLVGEISDPEPYFDETDVVVMPSDRPEPFGLVAIESFARGRPVIGSAAGGLRDIITDHWDGWLFVPRDTNGLAAILASLTRPQVERAGAQSSATYEERFTQARFARDWERAVAQELRAPGG